MAHLFKVIEKSTGENLGYILDTFTQLGKREYAKAYGATTPEEAEAQKEVILKNIEGTLSKEKEDTGFFDEVLYKLKMSSYKGLGIDDVEVQYEDIGEVNVTYNAHLLTDNELIKLD